MFPRQLLAGLGLFAAALSAQGEEPHDSVFTTTGGIRIHTPEAGTAGATN